MNHVSILDCTLRDGAYLIDKRFGNDTIKGIVDGLLRTHIDFIEIGFFQDNGCGDGKTVFRNSNDAKKFIPKDKKGCEFTVLADFSRYSLENLDEHDEDGVDAIRECFFKHERFDALDASRTIKEKGYKLFIQPVDILGYTDKELLEFLEVVNEIEPYCISIVDTFGSMYQEDLRRVFELINHNLGADIRVGFHSHNNMQLSNALSQEFARMTRGQRKAIIDGTISGMGRGAGNTPTELIIQYMVDKYNASYDIDALLDTIDAYMDNIKYRCSWGYSTEYFVAGAYGAHVNNIAYLSKKSSIRSKEIRFILNKIGKEACKRYDYDLLENTYLEMVNSEFDDRVNKQRIKKILGNRSVLVLAPGNSVDLYLKDIKRFINDSNPVVITINFLHKDIQSDFLYMSNKRRYQALKDAEGFSRVKKIFTSNFAEGECDDNTIMVSFYNLIKCGWESIDNSMLMLLRLLSDIGVEDVALAGFDGYETDPKKRNYLSDSMEILSVGNRATEINKEIAEMLEDFNNSRRNPKMNIRFITPSRFENILSETEKGAIMEKKSNGYLGGGHKVNYICLPRLRLEVAA